MKKKLLFIIAAFILSGMSSCEKKAGITLALSNDQAAEIMVNLLSDNTSGLSKVTSDIASFSISLSGGVPCGLSNSSTVHSYNNPGASYTLDYNENLTNTVNCNSNNQRQSYSHVTTYTGSFSNANIALTTSGTTTFTITGTGIPTFTMNGTHTTNGTFNLKNSSTQGTIQATTTVKDMVVGSVINSGTATIHLTGNIPGKGDFSSDGSLTFKGKTQGTLVINGTTYAVSFFSATATKQ